MYRGGTQQSYDGAAFDQSSMYGGRNAALTFRDTPMLDPEAYTDVWTSGTAGPRAEWIAVDFGQVCDIDSIVIQPMMYRAGIRNPQTLALQYSYEGEHWRTVIYADGLNWTDGQPKHFAIQAAADPLVVLDFVNAPVIPAGWTFQRSTSATHFDVRGIQHTVPANTPRFDCDPSVREARGLLLESARTNFLRNADAVEHWAPFAVDISTDGSVALDGATLARVVTESVSGKAVHAASQNVSMTVGPSSFTYWGRVRRKERSAVALFLANADTTEYCRATFDLSTGAVTERSSTGSVWKLISASAVPLGQGWWECRLTGAVSSAMTVRGSMYLADGTEISYPGDGASGIYHGGAQLELSGYASSYIPTGPAATTRAVELLTLDSPPWLGSGEGTILIDAAFVGVSGGGSFAFSLDDGLSNGIGVYKTNGSGALNAYVSKATPLGVSVGDGERFRAAIAWAGSGTSAAAAINGNAPIAMASSGVVTPTRLSVGSARGGSFNSDLWVRAVKYWPRRLEAAELSNLTRLS